MKYQIKDDLYLESDETQFYLREYTGKEDKDGKPLFKAHGFFGRPEHAITKASSILLARGGSDKEVGTLADLKNDIAETYAYIRKQLGDVTS